MVSDVTFSTALNQQQNTSASSAALAEDFSQFLNLLTVQLQNQDPLDPMDSSEFTSQLVQFTAVEQQINTNQKLDSLVSLELGNAFTSSLNYVGMDVTYLSSEFDFDGQNSSRILYALDKQAVVSKINVRDETGKVIYSQDASKTPGQHEFVWNGTLSGGGTAPPGTYSITVDALDVNDNPVDTSTVVTGRVKGIETQNGQVFTLVGNRAVPVSSIINTQEPGAGANNSNALTAALSYVGLDITYENSEINLDGSNPVDVEYTLAGDADRAKLLVFDDTGQVVYSSDVPIDEGAHTVTWDGVLNDGMTASPGTYQYVIDAIDEEDNRVLVSSLATGRVTGVETRGGDIFLVMGNRAIPLTNVTQINQPTTNT